MPQTVEVCEGCRRTLEADETPCLSDGRVLCSGCWCIINDAAPPVPVTIPPKIAGWLLLPAIGLILAPLFTLSIAGQILMAVDDLKRADALTAAAHSFEAFTVLAAVLYAIAQVVAAVFFFRKRSFVPLMMVGLYVSGLLYSAIMCAAVSFYLSPPPTADFLLHFTIQLLIAAIWSGYFLVSRRVKVTFIR